MKFEEFSEKDRISFIKDELVKTIEECFADPKDIKANLSEDDFKKVMDFIPSLKMDGCNCGACIKIDKIESRLPVELNPLIVLAKKRCAAHVYK